MPNYQKAPQDVRDLIDDVMTNQYPELDAAQVDVGALMALPSGNSFVALKLHGYPCAALIRIVSLRDRVAGEPDAQIIIDGAFLGGWKDWSDAKKRAVIDHELHHLQLKHDKYGKLQTDDHGRPKLKLKLHDWEIGGFRAVVERHGEAAVEYQAAQSLASAFGQLLFPWAKEQAATAEQPAKRTAAKRKNDQPSAN